MKPIFTGVGDDARSRIFSSLERGRSEDHLLGVMNDLVPGSGNSLACRLSSRDSVNLGFQSSAIQRDYRGKLYECRD